jgi:hypothetical protein
MESNIGEALDISDMIPLIVPLRGWTGDRETMSVGEI